MAFLKEMSDAVGELIEIPAPIRSYFDWVEGEGLVGVTDDGKTYSKFDPAQQQFQMYIAPPNKSHIGAFTLSREPAINDRLKPFFQTGLDGSSAAFWRDDSGSTQIVHIPSMSGSTMMGVLVKDAVDFLRLLAIGYDELCWPGDHIHTPDEVFAMNGRKGSPRPDALRNWVSRTFNVTIPDKAVELSGKMPELDGPDYDDPFLEWFYDLP